MSRITDYILEPKVVYTEGGFLVRVKVIDDYKYKKYIVSENLHYKTVQGTSFTITDADSTKQAEITEIRGKGKKRKLPSEYQEVEYIQSTGTQYINTGIALWNTTNWKIQADFSIDEHYNYNAMFGYDDITDTTNEVWIYGNTRYAWRACGGFNGNVAEIPLDTKINIIHDNSGDRFITTLNDNVVWNFNKLPATSNHNLCFGHRAGGGWLKGKIYGLKLWSEGILVRDMIPCYRVIDNVTGLYDTVNNTFYTNANTGSTDIFNKGSDINKNNVQGYSEIHISNKNINYKELIQGLYQVSNGAYVNSTKYVTLNGFLPLNYGETITVSTKNNETGNFYVLEYDKEGFYLNQEQHLINVNKATFTIVNENTKYVAIDFIKGNSVDITPEDIEDIQVIKGETISNEYTQHFGSILSIDLGGTNLVDFSTFTFGYVANNGTQVTSHTMQEMCSPFVKVRPNTTYTFSIQKTTDTQAWWIGIGEYTSNTASSFIVRKVQQNRNYMTFTTGNTTEYVRLSARNLEHATEVQFQIGKIMTKYSPYNTPIIILSENDKLWNNNGTWQLNDTAITDNYLLTQLQALNNIELYENLCYVDWVGTLAGIMTLQYAGTEDLGIKYIITEDGKKIRTDWRKLGRRKKWMMK